jgi:hypothetical protein
VDNNPDKIQYWDEAAEVTLALLESEWATLDQLRLALSARRNGRPAIGQLAVKNHDLTMAQMFQILAEQADTEQPFGQVAVRLGLLDSFELRELLHLQASLTPALSDVLVEQGVISLEQAETLWNRIQNRLRARPDTDSEKEAALA